MSSPPYSSSKNDRDPLLSNVDNVTYNPTSKSGYQKEKDDTFINVPLYVPPTTYTPKKNTANSEPTAPKQDPKIEQAHKALKETSDIMRNNIDKALARDVNINMLVDKSEDLAEGSKRFQKTSKSLGDKMWCLNCKSNMTLWIVALIVIILLILIIVIPAVRSRNR